MGWTFLAICTGLSWIILSGTMDTENDLGLFLWIIRRNSVFGKTPPTGIKNV